MNAYGGWRKTVFAQIKQILFLEVDQLKDCMIRETTLDITSASAASSCVEQGLFLTLGKNYRLSNAFGLDQP